MESVGEAGFAVRSSQELVAPLLLLSPVYTAWKLKNPTELAKNEPVVGTKPFVTVSVADPWDAPEQELPLYMVNFTVPPAVEVAPVSVPVSVTEPKTTMLEAESIVDNVGENFCTVSGSLQALVAGLLFPSPV